MKERYAILYRYIPIHNDDSNMQSCVYIRARLAQNVTLDWSLIWIAIY